MGFKKSYRKTRALRKIGNKAYDANDYPTGHIHYELANKNLRKLQEKIMKIARKFKKFS